MYEVWSFCSWERHVTAWRGAATVARFLATMSSPALPSLRSPTGAAPSRTPSRGPDKNKYNVIIFC